MGGINMLKPLLQQAQLIVKNLDVVTEFYQKVLGFQVIEKKESEAILSADGETPLLSLVENQNVTIKDPRTPGLYHIAFLLPSRSDLADITNYFIQTRYPLQGASDHDVSEALYLADPEGNGIEIYADRPADKWKWQGEQVFMTTVALNVEDLLKEASAGGWQGMPAKTIIGHIHLQMPDLDSAKTFYCDGLGFDPILKYGSQALFVSKEKYHHHLGLNIWNSKGASKSEEQTTGLDYFSMKVPDEAVKNEIKARLEEIGATVKVEDDHILTTDPAGIKVKISV